METRADQWVKVQKYLDEVFDEEGTDTMDRPETLEEFLNDLKTWVKYQYQ